MQEQQARLDEAFERIEETILPCIAMMLETLLDASAGLGETDPKALAAELQTLAAELEEPDVNATFLDSPPVRELRAARAAVEVMPPTT